MRNLQSVATMLALVAGFCFACRTAPATDFVEVNGVVSMEAEHFTRNNGYTVRNDDGPDGKAAGWSGDGWIYSDSSTAQRLEYDITFTNTGTYYLHLRTLAGYDADWNGDVSGIDNGYHAEFDGVRISGQGIYVKKTRSWMWFGRPQHGQDSESISFTVSSAGEHTFSIVRREELSRLDKIVIHDGQYGTDAWSTITGEGPAETTGGGTANRAPTASGRSVTVKEGSSVDITLQASDPDGDSLTYVIVSGPGHGTLSGHTDGDRYVTYAPAGGYTGSDSFTFKVNDGALDSGTATVSITVRANRAPVAQDTSVVTVEGTPVDITLHGSDPDGDGLTFVIVNYPTSGTLTDDDGDSLVTYTPDSGFSGSDSFTFKVSDGEAESSIATVGITVRGDIDGDGLPDGWEEKYGLDPNLEDTDGDGIADPDEDEDGDGYTNLQEYEGGTDPTRPDGFSFGGGAGAISCVPGGGEGAAAWMLVAFALMLVRSVAVQRHKRRGVQG